MATDVPWLGAAELSLPTAVAAVRRALAGGLDPTLDPPRSAVATGSGQLLLMPAAGSRFVGVKVATVCPANPELGLPRIQGCYLLLDPDTLALVALLDGAALTAVRTPAVSAVAVDELASPSARTMVVFGSGPQAAGHVAAISMVRPIEQVVIVGRDPQRAARLASRLPVAARVGTVADVADADVVVCATTANAPLFDGRLVADHATVVAVGSHQPDVSELDIALTGRASVVVEDVATALREAGEIRQAVDRGVLRLEDLVGLPDLVRGATWVPGDRPHLFKSVGMSWEDLVVAASAYRAFTGSDRQ